jgi:acetyl esterase/lipase
MALSLLCIAAALALPACAQKLPPVPLWPAGSTPPGENGYKCGAEALVTTPAAYGTVSRYYNVSVPTITPFLVANGSGAAVLIAPGGGYGHLAWDAEGTRVAQRFNEMGVSALVLKYRVPLRPEPAGGPLGVAQLMDAQRALGLARANAAAWGINASRLGFGGFSAGGHLTAHVSTNWAQRAYPRVDAADDLPCRPDFSLLIYPWMLLANNNASATALAPYLQVTRATPPALIVQNLDDTTAWPENSLGYARALALAGAPTGAVHLYPKGGHGFGLCANWPPVGGFEPCCEWPTAAQRFLQYYGWASGWPGNISAAVGQL